ncbi:PQQ-binding-like beta-propeller repeat protein, partial [Alkalibaculum sp. M08DMB]
MKYKRHISILLTMVMLFSILSPVGTIPVSAKEGETTPLKLETLTPETKVSLEGVEEELSLTFNQRVTILEGKQIQLLYDKEGDGKPNDPVLVQEEPEEGQDPVEPHDGIGGDKGEYAEILSIDEKDPNKVLVDLTYLEENLLQEDHVYQLNIYEVIKATDHEETFAGLGLTEEQDTWIFDTETHNEITSIAITGEDKVIQGESISLKATVKNQHSNALLKESLQWTTTDEKIAVVEKGSGEVTGVAGGKVSITATSTKMDSVKAAKEITVEEKKETQKATTSGETTDPLAITTFTPENGAKGVDITQEISLQFNKSVTISNVNPSESRHVTITSNDNKFTYGKFVPDGEDETRWKFEKISGADIVSEKSYTLTSYGTGIVITAVANVEEKIVVLPTWKWDTIAQAGEAAIIEMTGDTQIQRGQSKTLTATVKDDKGISISGETITWTSQNPSVATVDNTGKVTSVELGKSIITATLDSNENVKGTLEITVGDPGTFSFASSQTYSRRMTFSDAFLGAAMNNGVIYGIHETAVGSQFPTDNPNHNLYKIYAFDLYGHELWSIPIEIGRTLSVTSGSILPAFGQDGTIYAQLVDLKGRTLVYAISPQGKILWSKEIKENSIYKVEPLIIGNQLIITTQSKVHSLNINNKGSENWSYAYSSTDSPVTDGTNLYLLRKDNIQAIGMTGTEKWSYDIGSNNSVKLAPAFNSDNSKMYINYNKEEIRVLNPATGAVISEDPLNGYTLTEKNASLGELLMDGKDTLYALAYYTGSKGTIGAIIALNPDGTRRYTYESDHLRLYAVDDEGYVYLQKLVAEGFAVHVINPYGNQVETIPVTISSLASYNTMKVYGNVFMGARKKAGDVRVYEIQRKIADTPSSIEILEKNKELGVYLKESLGVVVKNPQGEAIMGQKLQWSSSNPQVVEVNADGTFNCKELGSATLTVTLEGTSISDSTTVQVVNKPSVPSSMEIVSSDVDVRVPGSKIELNQPCTFDTVVKDQYGKVMPDEKGYFSASMARFTGNEFTPISTGTATITAELNVNDDYFMQADNSVQVTVEKREAKFSSVLPKESIMTLPGSLTLKTGNQYNEIYNLEGVTWISSDESIATVDEDGVVTARDYGTVTITATAPDGTKAVGQVSILQSLGYQWNVQSASNVNLSFGERITTDSKGNDYYINPDTKTIQSVDPEGKPRWEKASDVASSYLKIGQGDKLYYINKDNKLICLDSSSGNVLWETTPALNSLRGNLQQAADGTMYVVDQGRPGNIYAYNPDGSLKWMYTVTDSGSIYLSQQFKLDKEGNLIFLAPNGNDMDYYKIKDAGTGAEVIETHKYSNCFIDYRYDFQVDDEGTVYFQFREKSEEELNRYGICAVKDGDILWKYYLDEAYSRISANKIILSPQGNLYFTSGSHSLSDSNKVAIYSLDQDGNENWIRELQDLVNPGDSIVGSADFDVDKEGNIYIPLKEKTGTTITKSIVLVLNPKGDITKYISYNLSKYNKFEYISLLGDNVYVGGSLKDQYIVKLPIENNRDHVADEIKVTASKSSIVQGDYLQLSARVYSQLGNSMPNETIRWSSDDETVATTDDQGKVTALKPGSVKITATCDSNAELMSTVTLTIVEKGAHYMNRSVLDERIQTMISYYKGTGIDGDWTAFGLGALGEDINSKAYMTNNKTYMARLWDYISSTKDLGPMTEYEKSTLAILSGGYDPTNFGAMNLIEKIYNYKNLNQGNNSVMWGLIALDAAGAKVPETGSKYSQKYFVDFLLENTSGDGWSLVTASPPDVDMTAMAITALAPYYNGWETYRSEEVKVAVDKAVTWLKTMQNKNGSFSYTGGEITNTESTTWVIIALASLGIDPQGDDFTRATGNPVSALLENQLSDGTFEHEKGQGSNGMATYQGLYGMAALKRFNEKGYSDIFYHIGAEEPVKVEAWMELITDINKLPEKITLKDEKTIQNLRKRYDALGKDKEKVTNLDRLIAAERRIVILKDKTAPGIITNLKDQKVANKTLTFTVKAIDNVSGELTPIVKLNGKEIAGKAYSYTVTLKEGKNTITIIAVDENGNKVEKTYTITYKPKKDQDNTNDGKKDDDKKNENTSTGKNTNTKVNTGKNTNTNTGSTKNETTSSANRSTGGTSTGDSSTDNEEESTAIQNLRKEISEKIAKAEPGTTVIIDIKEGLTINAAMLDELKEKENVTIVFKGENYTLSF